jgi:hypothetical protein
MYLLRWIKGKENEYDSFISGIIGGYLIFGDDTPVNQQIKLFRNHSWIGKSRW